MSTHARFSPSNSKRWLTCHQSMLLPPKPERGQTEYANRGTCLHGIAEDILLGREVKASYEGYVPTDDDMASTVLPYVEYVSELDVDMKWIEHKVFLTEDCYGTADFIGYNLSTRTLHVADLKAGLGVMVYAQGNTQARIYAIGAIKFLKEQGYPEPKKVITHIIQPGINNFGVEEVPLKELKALFLEVKSTINMIKNGEGDFAASDEACRWCPHKVDCPELNSMATKAAMNDFAEDNTLGLKMKMVAPLRHFIAAVEEESLNTLLQGKTVEGFKLVKGRGSRSWTNVSSLKESLIKAEIKPEVFQSPAEMLSVAQLEKSLKKAKVKFELDPFITLSQGQAKIAPVESPQKGIDKAAEAIEDFAEAATN